MREKGDFKDQKWERNGLSLGKTNQRKHATSFHSEIQKQD